MRSETRTCPECGNKFTVDLGKAGRPREYCTKACAKAVANRRWQASKNGIDPDSVTPAPAPRDERHCEQCGNRFKPPAKGRLARYCSTACRNKASRARITEGHGHLPITAATLQTLEKGARLTGQPVAKIVEDALDHYFASVEWKGTIRAAIGEFADLL